MTEPRSGGCPICRQPMFVPEVRLTARPDDVSPLQGVMLMQEMQKRLMMQGVMTHMRRHTHDELIACIVHLQAEVNRLAQS